MDLTTMIQILRGVISDRWEMLSEYLVPIQDWQRQELDRSKAQYDANPETLLTWEEVKANIIAKHA